MWPFRKPAADPPRPLVERVEEIEDTLRRLERRFVRMQGEFDRVNRVQLEDEEEDDDEFYDVLEQRRRANGG